MVWNVPGLWKDGDCWIIGGGPSMPRQFKVPESVIRSVMTWAVRPSAYSDYLEPIHNKHVIGVNNAYQIGDWIDICFFGDSSWYLVHRQALAKWKGIKATCCHRFSHRKETDMEGIKFLSKDKGKRHGISTGLNTVSWNGNSGAAAISLAVHLGVKRILLLGFDMNLDENQISHWHGAHNKVQHNHKRKSPPFTRHLMGFPEIAKDAKKLEVEILNVNPKSAINDFRKVELKDVLGDTKDVVGMLGSFAGRGSVTSSIAERQEV